MKSFFFALITAALVAGQVLTPVWASAPAASACKNTYIIRRGDALAAIARKCGVTLADLLAANPEIKDQNVIYPGMSIRIIAGVSVPPAGGAYVVQNGDTLGTIAEQYDTTVKELIRLNPDILDPRFIYVDQVLKLPGEGSGRRITLSANSVAPGWYLEVKVYSFPANANIDYRLGLEGGPFKAVQDGQTDANGFASTYITVPNTAKVGELWQIQVLTTEIIDGVQGTTPAFGISD